MSNIPTGGFPEDMLWLGDMDAQMAAGQFGYLMCWLCNHNLGESSEGGKDNINARILALYRWLGLQSGESRGDMEKLKVLAMNDEHLLTEEEAIIAVDSVFMTGMADPPLALVWHLSSEMFKALLQAQHEKDLAAMRAMRDREMEEL